MQPDHDIDPEMASFAHARFPVDLDGAETEEEAFAALYQLSNALVPVRLWTVMTLDLKAGLARRAFSNQPDAYPTSGTKPIIENNWFKTVYGERAIFVGNTLAEIAKVFADHERIGGLGCASVMNLPVFQNADLLATVNLLDVEGYFTPQRVETIADVLTEPALVTVLAARKMVAP